MILQFVLSLFIILSTSQKDNVKIENIWMREALKGMNSAVYCEIKNNSSADEQLLSVSCKSAKVVQVHETYSEGGNMGMRKAGDITIKGKSSFYMKPGGYHIMLIKLIEDLKHGTRKELIFKFKKAGEIKVLAEVKRDG